MSSAGQSYQSRCRVPPEGGHYGFVLVVSGFSRTGRFVLVVSGFSRTGLILMRMRQLLVVFAIALGCATRSWAQPTPVLVDRDMTAGAGATVTNAVGRL